MLGRLFLLARFSLLRRAASSRPPRPLASPFRRRKKFFAPSPLADRGLLRHGETRGGRGGGFGLDVYGVIGERKADDSVRVPQSWTLLNGVFRVGGNCVLRRLVTFRPEIEGGERLLGRGAIVLYEGCNSILKET